MKILLLTTNGLVGIDRALEKLFNTDNEFFVVIADWKTHKLKSIKKNGLIFSAKKFFWLKQQKSVEEICKNHANVTVLPNLAFWGPKLKTLNEDLLLSFGWDKKISMDICKNFKVAVNVHPSMLPAYRGWNPIKRAYDDNKNGGVTIHKISEEFDEGEILLQEEVDYLNGRQGLKWAYDKTMDMAGDLMVEFIGKPF